MNIVEKNIAVIGAGNIGQILIKRLRSSGVPADRLVVCDKNPERSRAVAQEFGVRSVILADEAVCAADAILIAVSPKSVFDVVRTFSNWICPCRLVISFAAAIPIPIIERLLRANTPVARVMPNSPSLIGKGINPVAYGSTITDKDQELVEGILQALGDFIVIPDDMMNWCVGLSGAAIRSLLPVLDGMVRAGVEAGLSEVDSRRLAAQVMLGTAALALETDLSFDAIKDMTPMETINEEEISQVFYQAARDAKDKMVQSQEKLIAHSR